MIGTMLRDRRQMGLVGSLVLSSMLATGLYVGRVVYSRTYTHGGMIWNLFLAWLPMLCALAAFNLAARWGRRSWWLIAFCAVIWLVFFPNAPYILTDIGNLRPRSSVPFWYDVLMYVAFAWSGTFLGLASLYLMQVLVGRLKGTAVSWLFALVALALGAFGVYLGRFPRFNSWDAFTSPVDLFSHIWESVSTPRANAQMFAFTALFALLLVSVYLMLVAFVHFPGDPAGPRRAAAGDGS